MTHLYIEQDTGSTEEVNSSIIYKLYELASSGNLDNASDLKGRLHSVTARDTHVAYLNANYPDLHVSADKLYITFADPEVDRILTQKFGDGEGVTEIDMLSVTGILTSTGFTDNTTIQTFNELGRFSTIKSLYTYAFNNCTSLTSIDLSNIEHVGGQAFNCTNLTGVINLPNVISIGDSQRGRSFGSCTNITEINIGSNFNADTTYMSNVFNGCTNLGKVTGFNNITAIPDSMFRDCSKLSQVDIDWTKIVSIGHQAFYHCGTNLSLLPSTITTPSVLFGMECFEENKDVQKIVLTGENVQVYNWAFYHCSNLTEIQNSNKITKIGKGSFEGCGFTTLDLSGVTGMVTGRILNTDQGGTESIISSMPNLQTVTIGYIPTLSANNFGVTRTSIHSCPNLTTIDIAQVDTIYVSHNPFIYNCPQLQKLILRCTTVPTLTIASGSSASTVNMTVLFQNATPYIYVPDAALNNYKTAPNWSNVAAYIKGISELPS